MLTDPYRALRTAAVLVLFSFALTIGAAIASYDFGRPRLTAILTFASVLQLLAAMRALRSLDRRAHRIGEQRSIFR